MKREKIKIPKDSEKFHFDFTNNNTFELKGETYEFVEDYKKNFGVEIFKF